MDDYDSRPRPNPPTPARARELLGEQVRVTVALVTRGHVAAPRVFRGQLIAVGRKVSNWREPVCLVIDAAAHDQGVPIIALRSVASIERDA